MSDTRFAPVDAPERETLREPPKRWRNKWQMTGEGWTFDLGRNRSEYLRDGDVVWGGGVFPSYEVAEAEAKRIIEEDFLRGVRPMIWLGAFPDGEAP